MLQGMYVALQKKFSPSDPEVVQCINELVDDENRTHSFHCSSDWVKLVTTGGLLHIKVSTYMVFQAMELVTRKYFQRQEVQNILPGIKHQIINVIKEDEDVGFYWSIESAEMDECPAENLLQAILLQAIIELWVTICGFSFTSAWVELYKQESHKNLQRSKGLQKSK